jgi:hypothetical protein
MTTTKAEAFAPPSWMSGVCPGETPYEDLLVEAYNRLGRPDLGNCLRKGWKYTWLNEAIGGMVTLEYIQSLSWAFADTAGFFDSISTFLGWALCYFEGNPTLHRLTERFGKEEFTIGGKWEGEYPAVGGEGELISVVQAEHELR